MYRVAATGVALLLAIAGVTGAAAQDLFVAGVVPSERPKGAPVVTEVAKDGAWYAQALHGVDSPYPASLRFLEDQGNWFDPFLHPGMTGPYDIRHWH